MNNQINHSFKSNCSSNCPQNYSISLINGTQCPQSCKSVTYKKLNVVNDQLESNASIKLELIQAEGLTEMTEEALYTLAKLFSEIGGLSSFCFGFSCIIVFELFELKIWSDYCQPLVKNVFHYIKLIRPIKSMNNRSNSNPKLESFISSKSKHLNQTYHIQKKYQQNHIRLNPIENCQVDGIRLSEYPKDDGSPLMSLKNHIEHNPRDGNKTIEVILDSNSFMISFEIEFYPPV